MEKERIVYFHLLNGETIKALKSEIVNEYAAEFSEGTFLIKRKDDKKTKIAIPKSAIAYVKSYEELKG